MTKHFTFVLALVALTVFAERQPYERYQSIVDRQMFGPLPPGFDPTKSPAEVAKTTAASEKELTKEQEKVKSSIRFSVINVTPEGDTAIGFTDNSDPKTPVHYYLKVGEESNGWKVKEADPAAATMTIEKDGIEVSLTLGGDSAQNATATQRSGGGGAAPTAGPATFGGGGRRGLLGGGNTLRARRMQRRQEEQAQQAKQAAESEAKEQERQAQAEQEKAQREAERAEQRQQLLAIQEELKKVREAKAATEGAKKDEGDGEESEQ